MTQRTMLVSVAPIYGARMGASALYLHRGKRLASRPCLVFDSTEREHAIAYARAHGFTRVRFSVLADWGQRAQQSIARVAP